MKITGFKTDTGVQIGRIEGDMIVPLGPIADFWDDPAKATESAAPVPLSAATLCPAIPRTGKVICIGLNYRAHAEEAGMAIPTTPVVFSRWTETLIADGEPSPVSGQAYDWEAEMGVVIGQKTRAADAASALESVFGYCTFNDLSNRALQLETAQWTLGKNIDRSGPVGAIVSADEAGNPAEGWQVTCDVNGERVQDGNTADFIFTVPEIIACVSRQMTLNPGDLIITGTPAGVGMGMKPQRYLKPGDVVRVEVQGLGAVTTPITA
ncbi:fumarylacetoacetate hydrolase family protein [Pararhodobacter zhoushanensis]|uniref:fumarylacetoacetate hydrolase family protein n=1 Tax=Pararhodobacter zhoushanensis TaxID=2479545 RepID=UPI000F8D22E7|nr:fumarylacetoacetate hydrolase family protein [Pararhodobacter zhoushanensis]